MDFIMNGQASGDVASKLLASNFNVNALRPYIGKDGKSYITQNDRYSKPKAVPLAANATATLRKDDWIHLDEAVLKVARERLRAVADLLGKGLTYSIPNGMGKSVFQTETQSDINDASISMDGLRDNPNDRPVYELTNLPLPITHKDFMFSARQIAISRSGNSPLDTTMAELAARKVAESNEQMLLGRLSTYVYGGGTIYGYTNYPARRTATFTSPAAAGWTGSTLITELLGLRQQMKNIHYHGPWLLYNAPSWDTYLDEDFKTALATTLRERILSVGDFVSLNTSDWLQNYDILMVQMTADVVREVIGMNTTTVQWDSFGGLQVNFKVMNIMVPQMRADQNGSTGIGHASV